jgi:choice-of-anchor B domain-containing protein
VADLPRFASAASPPFPFPFLFLFLPFSVFGQCVGLEVELSTGIWASELSWEIVDDGGNVVADGFDVLGAGPWADNTTYEGSVCLPVGCYELQMHDSYGDGWQGGVITLTDALAGNVLAEGAVPPSAFEAVEPVPLDPTCPLPGCTWAEAFNFDPGANVDDGSCVRQADNVVMEGHWTDLELPANGLGARFSDVEAVVVDGMEFAVVGSTMGTHFVALPENGEAPHEVAFVAGAFAGTGVVHRDFHVEGTTVYAVCDQGTSTLQIMEVGGLAAGQVEVVYDSSTLIRTAHNVFVNQGLLYGCSAKRVGLVSSVLVLNVANPSLPFQIADLSPLVPSCHDLHVVSDTAWINATGSGLRVVDMTATPQLIGAMTEYPQQGTNHSGWWNPDSDLYVFADETHGSPLKVVDTSDLSDMEVVGMFDSGTAPDAVAHNLFLIDNYVYVSYYHDGFRMFDISDPAAPVQVAYFDTHFDSDAPDSHSGYAGAWGVHAGLPSGRVLITDMQSGLFVLRPTPEDVMLCPTQPGTWNGNEISEPGVYMAVNEDPLWETDIAWAEVVADEAACILCVGDANVDCWVNAADLTALLADWGCTTGCAECPAECVTDWDGNGVVAIGDLMVLLAVWGTNCCD